MIYEAESIISHIYRCIEYIHTHTQREIQTILYVQQKRNIYSRTTKFRRDSGEHTIFYEWYHRSNNDMNNVNYSWGCVPLKYDGIWCDGGGDGDGDVQFFVTTVTWNGTKTLYPNCTLYIYNMLSSCRYQVIFSFLLENIYYTVLNKFSIFYFDVPFLAWIMLRHISKCSINV